VLKKPSETLNLLPLKPHQPSRDEVHGEEIGSTNDYPTWLGSRPEGTVPFATDDPVNYGVESALRRLTQLSVAV
jgi:hypothetical protein